MCRRTSSGAVEDVARLPSEDVLVAVMVDSKVLLKVQSLCRSVRDSTSVTVLVRVPLNDCICKNKPTLIFKQNKRILIYKQVSAKQTEII